MSLTAHHLHLAPTFSEMIRQLEQQPASSFLVVTLRDRIELIWQDESGKAGRLGTLMREGGVPLGIVLFRLREGTLGLAPFPQYADQNWIWEYLSSVAQRCH